MLTTKLANQDPINYRGNSMNTTTFTATNKFAGSIFLLTNQDSEEFNLVPSTENQIPLFEINKRSFQDNPYRKD